MAHALLKEFARVQQMRLAAGVGSDVDNKTVTGGAAHTKGAWVELIASTGFDIHLLDFHAYNSTVTATITDQLLDIGVGAAGSERVIVPNLQTGWRTNSSELGPLLKIPVYIPAGTRIAARLQGIIASDTLIVWLDCYGGAPSGGRATGVGIDTFGVNDSGNSKGVRPLPGSANIKGAWLEVVASTPANLVGLGITVQGGLDATMSAADYLIDLGVERVGSPGQFDVVIPDFSVTTNTSEAVRPSSDMGVLPLDRHIPAGSRLAVREASSQPSGEVYVAVHGVRG